MSDNLSMLQKLKQYNIILASNSPRRRELLTQADIPFTVDTTFDVDESYPNTLAPHEVAPYLAQKKSDAFSTYEICEKDILITADTVVIIDGKIIGKPTSTENAIEILTSLSGKTHSVITGVTLRTHNRRKTFSAESKVTFAELDPQEIQYYVEKFKPYDKAGAYGIQEWIGAVAIERIEGSFYNVMGLPIQMLYKQLKSII